MVYDIGDKNLIFKYISLNLRNLFMSKLPVSDEYTIELGKCIYDFLCTYYPQQTIECPDNSIVLADDIATYYLKGPVEFAQLKYIIILPEYDLGEPKQICGVYKYGGRLDDIPLFNFNVDNLSCKTGANTLWEVLPESAPYYNTDGIWQYLPSSGVQFIDTPEEVTENFCVYIGCNPDNEYYRRFYVKGSNNTYVDVTAAVSGYLFLEKTFSSNDYVFIKNLDDIDLSDYYSENSGSITYANYNIGATIYPIEQVIDRDNDGKSDITVYNLNVVVPPDSVDDINKYSLAHWYINDVVIQYLQPGIVVSESNTVDDIAQAEYQMMAYGYTPSHLGDIDEQFKYNCYTIQNSLKKKNPLIVSSGYYDIYVEGYVRSLGEVRK